MQCTITSNFNCKDLEQINHIWLYLKLRTLSDITLINGKKLKLEEIMSTLKHCPQFDYHQVIQYNHQNAR